MKGIAYIQSSRDYLDYIEEHLLNIEQSWKVLNKRCKDMRFIYDDFYHAIIEAMIDEHDLSKFSQHEFVQYRDKFFPVGAEDNEGFSQAWGHHKTHNPHHWENWTVGQFYNPNEWECHCVCMVVDWMAMGLKFGDTAQDYYEKNRGNINLPRHGVDLIYQIFHRISDVPDAPKETGCNTTNV